MKIVHLEKVGVQNTYRNIRWDTLIADNTVMKLTHEDGTLIYIPLRNWDKIEVIPDRARRDDGYDAL